MILSSYLNRLPVFVRFLSHHPILRWQPCHCQTKFPIAAHEMQHHPSMCNISRMLAASTSFLHSLWEHVSEGMLWKSKVLGTSSLQHIDDHDHDGEKLCILIICYRLLLLCVRFKSIESSCRAGNYHNILTAGVRTAFRNADAGGAVIARGEPSSAWASTFIPD